MEHSLNDTLLLYTVGKFSTNFPCFFTNSGSCGDSIYCSADIDIQCYYILHDQLWKDSRYIVLFHVTLLLLVRFRQDCSVSLLSSVYVGKRKIFFGAQFNCIFTLYDLTESKEWFIIWLGGGVWLHSINISNLFSFISSLLVW